MTARVPREGMMAVVRNRRALITGVQAFDADERGRFHLVEVEYTDGIGAESDQVLWEVEPDPEVLAPSALPSIDTTPPMDPRELDAMVRAARWSALTTIGRRCSWHARGEHAYGIVDGPTQAPAIRRGATAHRAFAVDNLAHGALRQLSEADSGLGQRGCVA